jgi:hypothetical protein
MARVQVSDEVWAAYRIALNGKSVGAALGELVRREVARNARRSAEDLQGIRLALDDARELSRELAELIARLEHASAAQPSRRPESGSSYYRTRPQF